jgi:hypothetical protein
MESFLRLKMNDGVIKKKIGKSGQHPTSKKHPNISVFSLALALLIHNKQTSKAAALSI